MKEALSYFPFVGLIGTALILFMSVFAVLVLWTYRKGVDYNKISQLPIEGGNHDN